MKKITSYLLALAFFAGMFVSCGKTTKGKMSNEWKVVSMEESGSTAYDGVTYSSYSAVLTETSGSFSMTTTPPGESAQVYSSTSTIDSHTMTISKNGTWKRVLTSTVENKLNVSEVSGTWSFIRKNKSEEFEKNERVLFNVLSENSTSDGVQQSLSTYLSGENKQVYVVAESTKKKLKLELETDFHLSDLSNSGTNDSKIHQIIVLEQK